MFSCSHISYRMAKKRVAKAKRIGLARALSKLGYCSRAQASVLIRAGRVALNSRVVRDPESPVRVVDGRIVAGERIIVDGAVLDEAPRVYLMMNKPRGVLTTASDEKGRGTVYDLLDAKLPWVGPVGRLDKASEGLLLLTNDSEWAARITAPSTHLDKKYHVQIDRVADAELAGRITRGADSKDSGSRDRGEDLRAKAANILRHGEKNSWLEITLDEGKNRQIRRQLEGEGVQVLRLVRVAVGPLSLGELKKSAVRELTSEEKEAMDRELEV
jgi:23S rRNA pseudouridine2605 synthase